MKTIIIIISSLFVFNISFTQTNDTIKFNSNLNGTGQKITIEFQKGKNFNHPLIAIWTTTTENQYIQTLYVSQSIAKGIYEHGKSEQGKWFPGEHRRVAALPYWAFSRNVKESDGLYLPTPKTPIADAYTGATPQNNFTLNTKLDKPLQGKIILVVEINQPFDFNNYWFNQKFEGNKDYRTSGQPSIIYAVTIDFNSKIKEYYLNPIGHGSPTGEDGILYTDISGFTTALKIAEKIKVIVE